MEDESLITRHLRPLHHSETLLINERSEVLETRNPVHRFGFGQSPFPIPEPLVAALREHASAKAYAPVQGIPELRTAVARFHANHDHVDWHPDRVLIGPGSKLLIYAVLAAFTRADVLLVSPSWVSYQPQAQLAGHTVYRLTSCAEDNWTLQPGALDKFCAQRGNPKRPLILILNSPGNPSGTDYEPDQLKALAHVMRQHRVIAISDEIYGMLHHQGQHRSLAQYYPEGTLVTGGLSKWCGAGGWRLGALHIPEALAPALKPVLLGVASETWSCVASPIQQAAIAAYDYGPDISAFVARQRQVLAFMGQRAARQLQDNAVQVRNPTGGFYLFPDFIPWNDTLRQQGITTSQALCTRLLNDAHVALLPGSAFGMPDQQLTARLAYVNFDGASSLASEADLSDLYQPIARGLNALVQWLQRLPRA